MALAALPGLVAQFGGLSTPEAASSKPGFLRRFGPAAAPQVVCAKPANMSIAATQATDVWRGHGQRDSAGWVTRHSCHEPPRGSSGALVSNGGLLGRILAANASSPLRG